MSGRNLVLGAAMGYSVKDVHPFLQSLARVGFNGCVALFIYRNQLASFRSSLGKAFADKFELDLVKVSNVREYAKFWRSCIKRFPPPPPYHTSLNSSSLRCRFLKFQYKPHVARYFYYADFLKKHKDYNLVLLSDVRDVIFQDDPFAGVNGGLLVSMENFDLTIGAEDFNRGWVLDAYGQDMLDRIGGCYISCSGVTLGDMESIKGYVDKMLGEICKQPFKKMRNRIYDQAFHNKLLHCGELASVVPCFSLQSNIATLGCMSMGEIGLSNDGKVLNRDGTIVPIVHQYDRHQVLVEKLLSA